MIGIEPGEWENNSIAWDKGKTETVGISQLELTSKYYSKHQQCKSRKGCDI